MAAEQGVDSIKIVFQTFECARAPMNLFGAERGPLHHHLAQERQHPDAG